MPGGSKMSGGKLTLVFYERGTSKKKKRATSKKMSGHTNTENCVLRGKDCQLITIQTTFCNKQTSVQYEQVLKSGYGIHIMDAPENT